MSAPLPAPTLAAYDEMPYVRTAFAQTHPDRLATLATLCGMAPPPVATCRVLELGCASGDNLIPMALGLPQARFVGIDLSRRQIDDGRQLAARLGLANVELVHGDVATVDEGYGPFDYVVCHGLYSWVPAPVRERILAICRANLAPNGVAYVSYNTLPGWKLRGTVRDMMVFHTEQIDGAAAKVTEARTLLDFLERHAPPGTPYALALRAERDFLQRVDDAYLYHDHLEAVNEPFYFHQFVGAARAHGLQYLAEAEFRMTVMANLPPAVGETLRRITSDVVRLEQYMDFVRNRIFRQTLLTHAEVPLDRNLDPARLPAFAVASAAQPATAAPAYAQGARESFRAPSGATFTSGNAITKAAMRVLRDRWPQGVPFAELEPLARARLAASGVPTDAAAAADDARLLGDAVLRCFAAGVVELHLWSPSLAVTPSERPVASPLARVQAGRAGPLTNLRHEGVAVDDLGRALLPLLDGSRGREDLVAEAAARVRAGTLVVTDPRSGVALGAGTDPQDGARRAVDASLAQLGESALLLG